MSLNNTIIPNNSYVAINDIGYFLPFALICHTNRPVSGTNSGGNWYSPEGERVSGYHQTITVQGLVSSRASMTVGLYRRTSSSPPPKGIYHCMIRDNVNTIHRIYVGIYDSESEAGESQPYTYYSNYQSTSKNDINELFVYYLTSIILSINLIYLHTFQDM